MYGPVPCHKSLWSSSEQQMPLPLPLNNRRLMHQKTAGPILLHSPFPPPPPPPPPPPRYHTQFHRSQSDLLGGGHPLPIDRSSSSQLHRRGGGGGTRSRYYQRPTLKQYIPVLWGWLSPDRPAAVKLRQVAQTWSQAVQDTAIYEALLTAESTTLQPLKVLRAAKNYEMAAAAATATVTPPTQSPTSNATGDLLTLSSFNYYQYPHQPPTTTTTTNRPTLSRLRPPRLCRCRSVGGATKKDSSSSGSNNSTPTAATSTTSGATHNDNQDYDARSNSNNCNSICANCGGEYLHSARTACTSRNNSCVRRTVPLHPIRTALWEFREAKSTTIESAPQTRESIIYWMARVIETMGWPISSFFTAVHAFDVAMASGIMPKPEYIPRISTSCVLMGVCSECDYKQMTKARWFVNQVPHVNNVRDLVISQMYIVSYLKGGSLMHKTPVDFVMIYLAAIDHFTPKFEMSIWDVGIRLNTHNITASMLEYIISPTTEDTPHSGLIPLAESMIDLCLCISVFSFINMTYPVLPMSKLIATIILDILMATHPSFSQYEFTQMFVKNVFRLDLIDEILPLWNDLNTLYQACKNDSIHNHNPTTQQKRFPGWSPRSVALLDHLLSLQREFPTPQTTTDYYK